MNSIAIEHIEVLKTLNTNGLLSRQAMKSIRGQVLNMHNFEEREAYLKTIIKKSAKKEIKQWRPLI
jgi:hypothetical protein